MICTAENGEKKEYTIIVKRAAAHDGTVEELPEETDSPTTDEKEPTEDTPVNTQSQESANGIAWWWLLVVGIVALAIGLAGGFFGKDVISKMKK